jgi:glycerol-3-phosphate dehydrogenase
MKTNSLSTGLFIAAMVISLVIGSGQFGKSLAQNVSSNQTANQTSMTNQSVPQAANQTNQTASKQPQLTNSDIQGIRKFVEDVKTDIANGKAVEALKTLNQIDDKLLVAMSANPPPMLEKSTDNNKK